MPTKINFNRFRMGHFILWQTQSGFVSDNITKHQLKMGFSEEASKYTHIDVSGGGPFVVCVAPPKTEIVDIRERYPEGMKFAVVRYKNDAYKKKKRYKVAFWASSNCNRKYDWFGVLKFKLKNFIYHKKNMFFCSENALWALQKGFPNVFGGMKPHECMPADFLNKKYFEIIYEGET